MTDNLKEAVKKAAISGDVAALTQLVAAHGGPAVRADDDPAGQRIVTKLLHHAPMAELWRSRQRTAAEADDRREYEEQVLGELLDDLRRPRAA